MIKVFGYYCVHKDEISDHKFVKDCIAKVEIVSRSVGFNRDIIEATGSDCINASRQYSDISMYREIVAYVNKEGLVEQANSCYRDAFEEVGFDPIKAFGSKSKLYDKKSKDYFSVVNHLTDAELEKFIDYVQEVMEQYSGQLEGGVKDVVKVVVDNMRNTLGFSKSTNIKICSRINQYSIHMDDGLEEICFDSLIEKHIFVTRERSVMRHSKEIYMSIMVRKDKKEKYLASIAKALSTPSVVSERGEVLFGLQRLRIPLGKALGLQEGNNRDNERKLCWADMCIAIDKIEDIYSIMAALNGTGFQCYEDYKRAEMLSVLFWGNKKDGPDFMDFKRAMFLDNIGYVNKVCEKLVRVHGLDGITDIIHDILILESMRLGSIDEILEEYKKDGLSELEYTEIVDKIEGYMEKIRYSSLQAYITWKSVKASEEARKMTAMACVLVGDRYAGMKEQVQSTIYTSMIADITRSLEEGGEA